MAEKPVPRLRTQIEFGPVTTAGVARQAIARREIQLRELLEYCEEKAASPNRPRQAMKIAMPTNCPKIAPWRSSALN